MKAQINIPALLSSGRNKYIFKAEAQTATIDIFGEIDEWWGFGVREMALNLSYHKSKSLNINIHSPGGSVTEGIGIANLIKSHSAKTTTTGVGFVASIASIVLLAGDTVQMAENAFLMIHNPWSLAMGDSEELRKTADLLDKMETELASVYMNAMNARGKTTTLLEAKSIMDAETWYTAQEAKDAGLIDEVVGRVNIAESKEDADNQFAALAKYKNIPQALVADLNKFSNKKNEVMAKDKSLFTKLGEIFATAAQEIEAPEVKEETPEPVEENADATMTIEEMLEAVKREGYTVAKKEEKPAAKPLDEEEIEEEKENPELAALRAQVAGLIKAEKMKAGAPSGGSDGVKAGGKNTMPNNAKSFFDGLATVIKNHRPN